MTQGLHAASKKYKYGESQTEYLNPSNYRYISHHAPKYHNVPLWVATNAMTMGQISAFYQYMDKYERHWGNLKGEEIAVDNGKRKRYNQISNRNR